MIFMAPPDGDDLYALIRFGVSIAALTLAVLVLAFIGAAWMIS